MAALARRWPYELLALHSLRALSEAILVLLESSTSRRSRTSNSYFISLSPSYYRDQNITRHHVWQDNLYKYSDSSNWTDSKSSLNDNNEVFNFKADNNKYKTGLLDINNFNLNDINVEDTVKLFKGNLYPLKYYIRGIHKFKKSVFNS